MPADLSALEALFLAFRQNHKDYGDTTLTQVLDDAWDVYFEAESLKCDHDNEPTQLQLELINDVSKKFLKIMGDILGTQDEIEILALMEKRMSSNQIEDMDTGYLPNQTTKLNSIDPYTATSKVQYNWKSLASKALAYSRGDLMVVEPESRKRDKGIGQFAKPTKMFSKEEREKYRVLIGGGKLRRFDFVSKESKDFTTLGMESHGKRGFAAFVIDANGEMFCFNHLDKSDQVAHSSLVSGGPVRAAGEISVLNGVVAVLTTHSGHYLPGKQNLQKTLKFFQEKSVDLTETLVHFIKDPGLVAQKQKLPYIEPSEEGAKIAFQNKDLTLSELHMYLHLTKFVYKATDILDELG